MTIVRAWIDRILRTALTVLLLTALVTPALAETGCFGDKVSHEQLLIEGPDGGVAVSSDSGSNEDQGDRGGNGHCAFAHGHCSFVAPSGTAAGRTFTILTEPYLSLAARRLMAAPRDGPERPPQA